MGKQGCPRPINRHAATKAAGCWGPRHSALAPSLQCYAKSKCALGPGLLSVFWERGSPDLPACGLRRGSSGGLGRPIFISAQLKTLVRGQASRGGRHGASSGTASSGWLVRRRRDQGGVPHEVPVTQAMMTKGARRVPARTVSSFPLWCKGGKHSRGVPRHQAKVTISVQRDQDQQSGRTEVTVEPKTASSLVLLAAEDHCRCQNRQISGSGSQTVRLGQMVTGGKGHEVLPRFGPSRWR